MSDDKKLTPAQIASILGVNESAIRIVGGACDCPVCAMERVAKSETKAAAQPAPSDDMAIGTVVIEGEGSEVSCRLVRDNIPGSKDMVYSLSFKSKRPGSFIAVAPDGRGVKLIIGGADAMGQVSSFIEQVSEL